MKDVTGPVGRFISSRSIGLADGRTARNCSPFSVYAAARGIRAVAAGLVLEIPDASNLLERRIS